MKYSIIFSAISLFSFHQIAQALPAKRDQGITGQLWSTVFLPR